MEGCPWLPSVRLSTCIATALTAAMSELGKIPWQAWNGGKTHGPAHGPCTRASRKPSPPPTSTSAAVRHTCVLAFIAPPQGTYTDCLPCLPTVLAHIYRYVAWQVLPVLVLFITHSCSFISINTQTSTHSSLPHRQGNPAHSLTEALLSR